MNKVHDLNLSCSFFWVIPYEDGKFCSIFIGWVNKKNNLEQNARVFLQVKVQLKSSLHQLGGCSMAD
jgi:hypothetical protein